MKISEKRLEELKSLNEKDIDFSDNPETDSAFWADAKIIEPDPTVPITLRVKKSTLAFYQNPNKKGYQTKMKKVLIAYKNAHEKPKESYLT